MPWLVYPSLDTNECFRKQQTPSFNSNPSSVNRKPSLVKCVKKVVGLAYSFDPIINQLAMKRTIYNPLTRLLANCSLVCIILIISATAAFSQAITIDRQVIGNTGFSVVNGAIVYQYTVGEAAIATLAQGTMLLTQGFQQPEFTALQYVPQIPYITDFIVFPNPASDYTKVRFNLFVPGNVVMLLVNNAGQIVLSKTLSAEEGLFEYTIPLQSYASGIYYVVISIGPSRKYTEKLIIQ